MRVKNRLKTPSKGDRTWSWERMSESLSLLRVLGSRIV